MRISLFLLQDEGIIVCEKLLSRGHPVLPQTGDQRQIEVSLNIIRWFEVSTVGKISLLPTRRSRVHSPAWSRVEIGVTFFRRTVRRQGR